MTVQRPAAAELYAADVGRIHAYLKARGIRTMLWAEKLLNAIGKQGYPYGGAEDRVRHDDGRIEIRRPATYRALELVPKDIIAHHWYWGVRESFDDEYLRHGLEMVYGNFDAYRFPDWKRRLAAGAKGGSPSHWSSLEPDTLQRNGVYLALVYGACLFWSDDCGDERYEELLSLCFEELFRYKNRAVAQKPHFELVHSTTLDRPWTGPIPTCPACPYRTGRTRSANT